VRVRDGSKKGKNVEGERREKEVTWGKVNETVASRVK